ncbi:hypothetical protein BKA66DRAFT_601412 [Pyrenochaeta sp. MPI-SDFR-AT-0127]|nr:hypothetical protein BKA66DRAFT_601412 [Pyrenochaeta sp. MPI-SDFR-AT-0127]
MALLLSSPLMLSAALACCLTATEKQVVIDGLHVFRKKLLKTECVNPHGVTAVDGLALGIAKASGGGVAAEQSRCQIAMRCRPRRSEGWYGNAERQRFNFASSAAANCRRHFRSSRGGSVHISRIWRLAPDMDRGLRAIVRCTVGLARGQLETRQSRVLAPGDTKGRILSPDAVDEPDIVNSALLGLLKKTCPFRRTACHKNRTVKSTIGQRACNDVSRLLSSRLVLPTYTCKMLHSQ